LTCYLLQSCVGVLFLVYLDVLHNHVPYCFSFDDLVYVLDLCTLSLYSRIDERTTRLETQVRLRKFRIIKRSRHREFEGVEAFHSRTICRTTVLGFPKRIPRVWSHNHYSVCHGLQTGIRYSIFLSMASRIVSWSDNGICISPVPSSTASIVSFDSTFSDTAPSYSQMTLASEALKHFRAEFGDKNTSPPRFSEGSTPRGGHATSDESFVRHDTYFFKDGNVTFLVCGLL
jgi:hypothetical protein